MWSVYIFLVAFKCFFVCHIRHCLASADAAISTKGKNVNAFVACIFPCVKNYKDQLRDSWQYVPYSNSFLENINFTAIHPFKGNNYTTKKENFETCISPCITNYTGQLGDSWQYVPDSNSFIKNISLQPTLGLSYSNKGKKSNTCLSCLKECGDYLNKHCQYLPYDSSIFLNISLVSPQPILSFCLKQKDIRFERCVSLCVKNYCSNHVRDFWRHILDYSKDLPPAQQITRKTYDDKHETFDECFYPCVNICNTYEETIGDIRCYSKCQKYCNYKQELENTEDFDEGEIRRKRFAKWRGTVLSPGLDLQKHSLRSLPQWVQLKSKHSTPKNNVHFGPKIIKMFPMFKKHLGWKIMKRILKNQKNHLLQTTKKGLILNGII